MYWYSSELAIFNIRNSKFKERHNVKENLIIIGMEDISMSTIVRMQLGWSLDLDVIMVNQFIFTFNRQVGYLNRNDTSETWYWNTGSDHYAMMVPNLKYDYKGETGSWIAFIILNKFLVLIQAVLAFTFLSTINALLIRVAIMCSSIVIFPLITCT